MTETSDLKLGLYGACLGAMATPDAVRIARLAEELGYESLWSGEHMVLPDPRVPPMHRDPDHPFFDPIVGMTYLAAHTTTIKFGLGVLQLAQRHPVQLAKEIATLDIVSGQRLLVGVGVGYLESEYRAIGVDYHTRGQRTDEYLDALRALWTHDRPTYKGRFVSIEGVNAYPRPLPPGLPIVIGGWSKAARRRMVAHGSGWYGFNLDPDEARRRIEDIRELLAREGRTDAFEITIGPKDEPDRRMLDEYAAAGANRVVIRAEGDTLDEVEAIVRRHAPHQ